MAMQITRTLCTSSGADHGGENGGVQVDARITTVRGRQHAERGTRVSSPSADARCAVSSSARGFKSKRGIADARIAGTRGFQQRAIPRFPADARITRNAVSRRSARWANARFQPMRGITRFADHDEPRNRGRARFPARRGTRVSARHHPQPAPAVVSAHDHPAVCHRQAHRPPSVPTPVPACVSPAVPESVPALVPDVDLHDDVENAVVKLGFRE